MANRTLTALLCALVTAVAVALPASAAAPVAALTGLSASPSYGNAGNLKPGQAFTLEAWLYPTGWRDYTGREKHGLNFMYKGRIGSHIDFVFALQENGILCLGNTHGYIGVQNKRIPASKWTHVAVTVNNKTGDIRFYINGAYVGNGSGWQGRNPGRVGFVSYTGGELDIGGFNQHGWGYNNDNFKGQMADVRIWNVIRTEKQIADNYKKQLSGKESGLMAYWTFTDAKDKTGHGWNLSLGGDAKCSAGKGPSIEPPAGITAAMAAVTPFYNEQGAPIALSASGSSTTGTIAAATFTVASLDGGVSLSAPADTLQNNGTNFTAGFSWTSTRPGVYCSTVTVTNAALKSSLQSKPAWFAVLGPFLGKPVSLPGTIQAENFNVGEDGVEYHDTDSKNTPGLYRSAEGADIANGPSSYVLTNAVAGEWLRYDVSLPGGGLRGGKRVAAVSSNLFLVSVRLSAKGSGGAFSIKPDGDGDPDWPAASFSVPDTGAWTTYKTVEKAIWLPERFSAVRLSMDKNGSSGKVACFDWFSFKDFIFELGSTYREFTKDAVKSKQFSVTANTAWTVKTDSSWVTLRTKSGSGNGIVVFDLAANTEADRTAQITVSCAGISQTYTLFQKGSGPARLELPSDSRELSKAAAVWKAFSVKANFTWSAKTDVSWIKLRTKGAKGSSRLFYDVTANNGNDDRTGHITVSGSGLSRTYTIVQKGIGPATLTLSSTSREVSASAAAWMEFSVKANVSWTTKTDASWIKLRTKGANGSSRVFFDVAANTGAKARVARISISSSKTPTVTYTLTQKARGKALPAARSIRMDSAAVESAAAIPDTASEAAGDDAADDVADEADEAYPFVEASDGSDASAVLDGDFSSSWSPADENGCSLLIALSPDDPVPGEDVCVWGEFPEETRIFGASGDGDWTLIADDAPGSAYSLLYIDIPATFGIPSVSEVSFDPDCLPPFDGDEILDN